MDKNGSTVLSDYVLKIVVKLATKQVKASNRSQECVISDLLVWPVKCNYRSKSDRLCRVTITLLIRHLHSVSLCIISLIGAHLLSN